MRFLVRIALILAMTCFQDQLVAGNETGEDVRPVPWYRTARGWLDKLEETSSSGGDPDVGFTVSGYPVITTVDCCPNHQVWSIRRFTSFLTFFAIKSLICLDMATTK